MLNRSPLIRPISEVSPGFADIYRNIMAHDKFSHLAYKKILHYDPDWTRCVLRYDSTAKRDVTHLLLFPFKVTLPACNVLGTLHGGMLMTLTDMCTSFHIGERLLPSMRGHVSITLSTNFVSAARKDEHLVAVSRIERMGKRVAYTSIDFLVDEAHVPHAGAMHLPQPIHHQCRPGNADGLPALDAVDSVERMLRQYRVAASGKHVKSLLAPGPSDLNNRS